MVVNRQATMYSEIYGILNMLGNDYKDSIPKQILNLIEDKRFKDYTPKFSFIYFTADLKLPATVLSQR